MRYTVGKNSNEPIFEKKFYRSQNNSWNRKSIFVSAKNMKDNINLGFLGGADFESHVECVAPKNTLFPKAVAPSHFIEIPGDLGTFTPGAYSSKAGNIFNKTITNNKLTLEVKSKNTKEAMKQLSATDKNTKNIFRFISTENMQTNNRKLNSLDLQKHLFFDNKNLGTKVGQPLKRNTSTIEIDSSKASTALVTPKSSFRKLQHDAPQLEKNIKIYNPHNSLHKKNIDYIQKVVSFKNSTPIVSNLNSLEHTSIQNIPIDETQELIGDNANNFVFGANSNNTSVKKALKNITRSISQPKLIIYQNNLKNDINDRKGRSGNASGAPQADIDVTSETKFENNVKKKLYNSNSVVIQNDNDTCNSNIDLDHLKGAFLHNPYQEPTKKRESDAKPRAIQQYGLLDAKIQKQLKSHLQSRINAFRRFSFSVSEKESNKYLEKVLNQICKSKHRGTLSIADLWSQGNKKQFIQESQIEKSKRIVEKMAFYLKEIENIRLKFNEKNKPLFLTRKKELEIKGKIDREFSLELQSVPRNLSVFTQFFVRGEGLLPFQFKKLYFIIHFHFPATPLASHSSQTPCGTYLGSLIRLFHSNSFFNLITK